MVDERDGLPPARNSPVGEYLDRVRLRPHNRQECPLSRLTCTPARWPPFCGGFGIGDQDNSFFAFAFDEARVAPGAILLPAKARLMEGLQNHIGTDLGEAVLGMP